MVTRSHQENISERLALLEAFVAKIAAIRMCDDPGETCHFGSGPYCSTHRELFDDEICEARELVATQ